MRTASVQLKIVEESKEKALDHASQMILQCRGAGPDPPPRALEYWIYELFDRYREGGGETEEGPTLTLLRALTKELSCYLHTGSFVEKRGDRFYNSSFLLNPKGEILEVTKRSTFLPINLRKQKS